jgi:predicted dehydrogenase
MADTFRFVIVGSGNIGGTYATAVGKVPGACVAGVVSRGGARPAGVSEEAPVAPSLAKIAVPFDAVILATPNGAHHTGALEAAALGKHVLTEKVLDIKVDAMDAMTKACLDAGVKLGVSFQRRVSPDNLAVKKLLDAGALGRIFAADLNVKFYRDQTYYDSAPYRGGRDLDGGGPFIQQAAHNVDILCWFFGLPDKVVSMLGTFVHEIEGEDHGAALLRYPDGMIGTLIASTSTKPGFPATLEIFGEKGTLILENDVISTWEVAGVENPSQAAGFKVHSGASNAAVSETEGHETIIRDFIAAVREDRDPIVPPASARMATELVLRIYAADIK